MSMWQPILWRLAHEEAGSEQLIIFHGMMKM
jgi:hypothetical protein